MNFQELAKYINYDQISLSEALIRLAVAGLSGFLISSIYRLYHGKEKSQTDMMHSLIFLSLIICSAMMIIGNNLASAFGLVGAVSIIRFRTSVKSARDMAFVFFAVVIGMSCGLGFLLLAIIGLLFTGTLMIIIHFISKQKREESLSLTMIKISYTGKRSERKTIEDILNQYSSRITLSSMKIVENKISLDYKVSFAELSSIDSISESFINNSNMEKLKIAFTELES